MKRTTLILVYLIFFTSVFSQNPAMYQEVKKYCQSLGYGINANDQARILEVYLPDGSLVDAFDFFRGRKGKKYSYCYKKGYKIKPVKYLNKKGRNITIPVCYDESSSEEIYLLNFMYQNGVGFF